MQFNKEVQSKIANAGELLIRAAAVLGTLSADDQRAINDATDGAAIDSLAFALQGVAKVSPQIQESLRTHPPAGFNPSQERLAPARPRSAS